MNTGSFKKMVYGFCLWFAACALTRGQEEGARLVVRADDMGAFHSANRACIESYRKGIETSVEVMAVAPWFPEAAKMLREHPGLDVGLHLVLTSEWENIKWRPLTQCPGLTDANGYFYPMMGEHPAYPGQSVSGNRWHLSEIEQEFRAQIELALKNIPQLSHLTGHMGATSFDREVAATVKRLAAEYRLPAMDVPGAAETYHYTHVGYDGPGTTPAEKEAAFIRRLERLEPGKNYIFLDHPSFDNAEMETVGHIGYENVAADRQGVVELFTSDRVKQVIREKNIRLINYNDLTKSLPRTAPAAEKVDANGIARYLDAVKKSGQDLHSLMVVRNGKVVAEHWLGEHASHKPHVMFSVSKTYTATAIGFAVAEGRLKVSDRVISFFPDKLPEQVSEHLKTLEIRHLLTMSSGHDVEPKHDGDWLETFFASPFVHAPGTQFVYNSMATYVLSAIIQRVTGEKLTDYLYPRLFRPLGIAGAVWEDSPQGISIGGWGLHVKTEDMAKLGLFILQKGRWNGEQLLPEAWFDEATTSKIASLPAGTKKEDLKVKPKDSDWLQGYGYQMWRSRHRSFRADGANGQYILILPEKNAVIVTTAHIGDMQAELNLIWKYLLPALK
ncbi:MAG: ChbG/HpnK family deacetylase [Tannerella sp.]|nr:ChbG/HpnK family deacetylase [Tannerella sp.]